MARSSRVPTTPTNQTPERELLVRLAGVLDPLDAKIDYALYVGTVEQMRADLSYLRGILSAAHAVIRETIDG